MKKFNSKKIFKIFSIVLVSICVFSLFSSCVFAQINPDTSKVAQNLADGFNDFVKNIGSFAANSMFSGLASLITTLAVVLYLLLALLFSGGTGSIFPAPDNIIFNRIAILDVNFFNPNKNSIIAQSGGNSAGNIVAQIYNTFQTIALSVFVIAAMIVGIKLALSSIAQEKAQCKKAITNWVIGIVLLFLMRLILAAILELNEYIVYELSTTVNNVEFEVNVIESIPFIGSALNGIVGFISSVFTGTSSNSIAHFKSYGYAGFLLKYAGKAIGGDLLSSILLFVLMGQTITLLVSYGKRCVYVIILGVMAPLIVAVDTIGKSYKGQSTVLSNWFKEIVLIVFTQTFHAMIMVITLSLISAIDSKNSGLSAIAAIILTAGIVKFEKLYRQLFGISDSMLGNLQGQAGKVMAGIHGAMQAGKALADNGKKYKDASQKRKTAIEARQRALTTQREIATDQNRFNTRDITTTATNLFAAAMVEKDPAAKYAKLSKAQAIVAEGKAKGYDIPDWVSNPIAQQLGLAGGSPRKSGGSGAPGSMGTPSGMGAPGSMGGPSGGNPMNPANGGAPGASYTGGVSGPIGGKSPIRQNMNVAESFDSSSLGSEYFTSNSVTSTYNQSNQQVVQVTGGEYAAASGSSDKRKHGSSNPNVSTDGNAAGGSPNEKLGNDTFSRGGHTTNTVAENAFNDSKNNDASQIVSEMKEMLEQMKHQENIEKTNRNYDNKYKDQQTKLKEAEKNLQQANRDMGAAALATFMGPANLAAGIGVGLGSGDTLSDSMLKGGYTTAGLDKAAEKIGSAVAGSVGKTVRDTLRQSDRRSSVDSI